MKRKCALKIKQNTIRALVGMSLLFSTHVMAQESPKNQIRCTIEKSEIQPRNLMETAIRRNVQGWAVMSNQRQLGQYRSYEEAFRNLKSHGCELFDQKECRLHPNSMNENATSLSLFVGNERLEFENYDSLLSKYDEAVNEGVCSVQRKPMWCDIRNNNGKGFYVSYVPWRVSNRRASKDMTAFQAKAIVDKLVERSLCVFDEPTGNWIPVK